LPIDSGDVAPRFSMVNGQSSRLPHRSAGFRACGFAGLSSPAAPREQATGKSPEPADRNVCPTGAFSMVELLVAMTLLSLIVLALMAVFNSTQRAFRASVTQTDILEGSRSAMDLITRDLNNMVPSDYSSNYYNNSGVYIQGAVNFMATNNAYPYVPLGQPLPGTSMQRTNVLEYFFLLGRENTKWTAAGYIVNSSSSTPLYPLYRFYEETNVSVNPLFLYWNFTNTIYNAQNYNQWTNLSHVMDGVVHLTVRPYDINGYWMTNNLFYVYPGNANNISRRDNVWFSPYANWGEVPFVCYSNAVPATVELELGVLEDRTLQRAESLGIAGTPPSQVLPQWNYLQNQSGHVHLFRQRVTIPNVDPSAYQ
jgi:type II secretory pathway component PulJ